jgi:hypothetical protein
MMNDEWLRHGDEVSLKSAALVSVFHPSSLSLHPLKDA